METPKKRLPFKGIVSAANAHEVPFVAQDNLTTIVAGQLTARPGMRAVTFASAQGSATAYQVTAMFAYRHPLGEMVIYADSNGDVHVGRTPS